jgi:3'(2'), 5'-bisphosphate nucleotidase
MKPTIERAELLHLRDQALQVASEAGTCILEVYGPDGEGVHRVDVAVKGDQTPVTTADMAAHALIVERLKDIEPRLPVLSEESDMIPLQERHDWPAYWLVDPLDGTREFLRRNGEFAVNIALVVDHRPVIGVVLAPVLNIAYHAVQGAGAWKQVLIDDQWVTGPIKVRSIPESGVVVARSRCPSTCARLKRFLDRLGEHDEISMGSALKSCLVAEGAADVYARLGPTGEWDTGAAQCIVEEAGGHLTDTSLQRLRYNERDTLINPHFVVFGDAAVDWADHLAPRHADAS